MRDASVFLLVAAGALVAAALIALQRGGLL
jgi:hypothetical protein